ncbi:MAG: alpha/beta hydrolase [Thermoplasmata archaeon]
MLTRRIVVSSGTRRLPASLTLPTGAVRAVVVALNPTGDQSKDQILIGHLVQNLPSVGVAVLRFDHRPKRWGWNEPIRDQADDALAAISELSKGAETSNAPIGIWGWDQGCSAAVVAAATSNLVQFLILVACSGVTPSEQMRYGTAEHLRRAGFGEEARQELIELRSAYEGAVRGSISRAEAQRTVNRYAARSWFPIAWVPRRIQWSPTWPDMDFDPRDFLYKVVVPTLLFYGETDEWSPIDLSIESWRLGQQVSQNGDVQIVRPRGTGHAPTIGSGMSARAISPDYTYAMGDWLKELPLRLSTRPMATPRPVMGGMTVPMRAIGISSAVQ